MGGICIPRPAGPPATALALDTTALHQQLSAIWGRHAGDLRGARRDYPRLVGRVDVVGGPAALPPALESLAAGAGHPGKTPPAVYRTALMVAHLFGDEEVARCAAAIRLARAAEAEARDAVEALFTALGMHDSPTVRALKCVQQVYVISAYADLKDGPLRNVVTNDDRTAQGWRVTIAGDAGDGGGGVRIVHRRRERLPEYAGSYIHWELATVFEGDMARHTATELRLARLEVPAPTITVSNAGGVGATTTAAPILPASTGRRGSRAHRRRGSRLPHAKATGKLLKKIGLRNMEVLLTRAPEAAPASATPASAADPAAAASSVPPHARSPGAARRQLLYANRHVAVVSV